MRRVENAECSDNNNNKHSISLKSDALINAFSLLNRTLFFQAIKNVSKKVNKRIKREKHYCQ